MNDCLNCDSEWLETNGLGGFASGTVGGRRTRRYHALLLAATNPPTGRLVLVNGIEVWIEIAGQITPLQSRVDGYLTLTKKEGFRTEGEKACIEPDLINAGSLVTQVGNGVLLRGYDRLAERYLAITRYGVIIQTINRENGQHPSTFERLEREPSKSGPLAKTNVATIPKRSVARPRNSHTTIQWFGSSDVT